MSEYTHKDDRKRCVDVGYPQLLETFTRARTCENNDIDFYRTEGSSEGFASQSIQSGFV
jgi:hypothetical protein